MDLESRVSALESMVNRLAEKNSTLQKSVSLKVSKGDVTSELNIEAGRIVIDGEVRFVGGTIEASKVNIINLKEEK